MDEKALKYIESMMRGMKIMSDQITDLATKLEETKKPEVVQEKMQSDNIGKLALALSKAQREFIEIGKNKKGQFAYADRHFMKKAYEDALAKYGLAISCGLRVKQDNTEMFRCVLIHESDQWIASECLFEPQTNGKRSATQERGSDMTYLARYMASLMLNFTTANDPDDRDGEEIKRTL